MHSGEKSNKCTVEKIQRNAQWRKVKQVHSVEKSNKCTVEKSQHRCPWADLFWIFKNLNICCCVKWGDEVVILDIFFKRQCKLIKVNDFKNQNIYCCVKRGDEIVTLEVVLKNSKSWLSKKSEYSCYRCKARWWGCYRRILQLGYVLALCMFKDEKI